MFKRVPIRGADWDDGSDSGPFALNLDDQRSNSDWDIAFRILEAFLCERIAELQTNSIWLIFFRLVIIIILILTARYNNGFITYNHTGYFVYD